MDFAIRKDASDWFKYIRSNFSAPPGMVPARDFDAFYFCFVAGIKTMRKNEVGGSDTRALVDNFPGPYKNRGRLLVSLFLSRELEYLGVVMSEKKAVNAAITKLVDPDAQNFLSDDGVREFNKYAHGGYDVLHMEWFNGSPYSLETFLRTFRRKVESADPGLAA
ncbi:hypothetical protein [Maritimibacter sp. 55A14]|uniref:hypothetical protein n=1 Tax=Maritimibacter sp. 55A14 TaxID=2174844 RepID=UPI0018EE69A9|nr:hypothetical protein [Maritimibacter sp. 55A14]